MSDTKDARRLRDTVARMLEEGGVIKLDVGGCGGAGKRGEDYLSVDISEDADIKAEAWDIPLPDGDVDEIWSSHMLEHVSIYKVAETLKEWHRVLKHKGRLIVQTPNMDYIARYWLTGPDRAWAEAMIFGTQANDGEYHKCAFTAATLRADLEAAGFEVLNVSLKWTHNQETLQAVCRK